MPLFTAGPGHQVRKGGKQLFVFDLNVLDDSSRKVYGLATGPQLDRENETILKTAVENALPNFMMLPIMHLDHTERPVGWFTKAEFRGQDLYVEACVKPTSDCDKFWGDVAKASREGRPYQFSIYGDRTDCTPSCALHPDHPERQREPCITKALELYSISICQPGTAINPNTFAEVMKAMSIDSTKMQGLAKATDSASNMIHPTTDGKYPKEVTKTMIPNKKENPDEEKKPVPPEVPGKEQDTGQEPVPSEGNDGGSGSEIKDLLTAIVEKLQNLESSLGGTMKAAPVGDENPEKDKEDETMEDEVKKCPVCAKKADPVTPAEPDVMTITKADLGRIVKAEERLATIEARLNTIEKSTAKGPAVVVMDPAVIKATASDDPTKPPVIKAAGSANAAAFGKLYGGK